MKKYFVYILVSVLFLFGCKNKFNDNPEKYYSVIDEKYENVMEQVYSLDSLLNTLTFSEKQVKLSFDKTDSLCYASIMELKKMKSFNGDKDLVEAAIDYIEEVQDVVNSEYKQLYDLYKKPFDVWEEEDFTQMYEILERIDQRMYDKEILLNDAQSIFIDENM